MKNIDEKISFLAAQNCMPQIGFFRVKISLSKYLLCICKRLSKEAGVGWGGGFVEER